MSVWMIAGIAVAVIVVVLVGLELVLNIISKRIAADEESRRSRMTPDERRAAEKDDYKAQYAMMATKGK